MKRLRIIFKSVLMISLLILVIPEANGQLVSAKKENRENSDQWEKIDQLCLKAESNVIAWRRDIHQNPELPGTVKFIFQPAEDSKPDGEEGGAELMIKEGVLENPKAEAIFGLHVTPYPVSTLSYRPEGIFASVDNFDITVKGKQTHGALPWTGIDAIPVSAQIILGIQNILSRQIDLTEAPAFITIGTIHGGIQHNILSGEVEMKGTIRTFSGSMKNDIKERIIRTACSIAESAGATADVSFYTGSAPVVFNDPSLTGKMSATLNRVGSDTGVFITRPITVGDDFSFYTQQIPGFYFLLGVAPKGENPARIINHSPYFIVDESALIKGVEALSHLTIDYLGRK